MKPTTTPERFRIATPIRLRKTTNTRTNITTYYCDGVRTCHTVYKYLSDYAMRNMKHTSTETFRHSYYGCKGGNVLISSETSWTPFPSILIG